MSHFTVLVIGDDPEGQLAPFCESCDNDYETLSSYFEFEEESEDTLKKYYADEDGNIDWGKVAADYTEHDGKYGYWSNPNAKWDWYSLGGRWTGAFLLKAGSEDEGQLGECGVFGNKPLPGYVDSVEKRHIDFDGMRAKSIAAAGDRWDTYTAIVEEHGTIEPRLVLSKDKEGEKLQAARNRYNNQKSVMACRDAGLDIIFGPPVEVIFSVSREEYIETHSVSGFSTFAVLMDGKWYEYGSTGWWVADEKEEGIWQREFLKLLESVDDDTLLSVYDCHI